MKFAHSTEPKRDIIIETTGEMEMPEKSTIVYSTLPNFTGRNVPIAEIAQAINKTPDLIRYAIREGIFHFGVAIKSNRSDGVSYCSPDKKVWEETGYFREDLKDAKV